MTTTTIAVKGSASDDFPADFAIIHFGAQFSATARSEALAGGNAIVAALRETAVQLGDGVRELKIQSIRVEETFHHVGADRVREHSGWVAQLAGQLRVHAGSVSAASAALIKTGVANDQLTWHLDPDTQRGAHRAVRLLAVANAKEAAGDFATALGATLGPIVALADPGLLGGTQFANGLHRVSTMALATAGRASPSWDASADIDIEWITVSANVEASYEVELD